MTQSGYGPFLPAPGLGRARAEPADTGRADAAERKLTTATVHALQLRRQVCQLLAQQHQTADALARAQADLARENCTRTSRLGSSSAVGTPASAAFEMAGSSTPLHRRRLASAHVRTFGASRNVPLGAFKGGSWRQWGEPNRPLTHKLVQDWIEKRGAGSSSSC